MCIMQTIAARVLQERLEPLLDGQFPSSLYTNYERGQIFYYNRNKSDLSDSTKIPFGIGHVYKLVADLTGHKPMFTSNEFKADGTATVESFVRAISIVNRSEIKSMYLGVYHRSNTERDGVLGAEAYDLVVTFHNRELLPLLVRFELDGSIVDYTSTSLNVALRYNFLLENGDIIKDANLSNILLQSVVEEVPKLAGGIPVRGENYFSQVGWSLEQCIKYSNNFNDLSMFAGVGYKSMSLLDIEDFTRTFLYPRLGEKFIPTAKLLDSFEEKIKTMVSILDDAPDYPDEDVKDTAPAPEYDNTEEDELIMSTEQLNTDTQEVEADIKKQPCANCIDTILKNTDLGLSDAQRYAIVGLMAIAFDMQIPD